MKHLELCVIVSCLLLVLTPSLAAYYHQDTPQHKDQSVSTRIVVKLRADVNGPFSRNKAGIVSMGIPSLDGIGRRHGVSRQERLFPIAAGHERPSSLENVFVVTVPEDTDIFDVIADYRKLDEVEYAEPDYEMQLYEAPNDPLYPHQ
ncbi:MAG: hypothetical protein JSU69_04970, partial [Candidatus Zixiibacteriota bacterium]